MGRREESEGAKEQVQKIRYLSRETVQWIHKQILDLTGGERGDLSEGNLDFALTGVKAIGGNLNLDKTIVKKTAFLLHNLVTRHPFVNGNKRTALEVVEAFLELNGYTIRVKKDEALALLSEIASGKATLSQVEDWTATNLAKISDEKG